MRSEAYIYSRPRPIPQWKIFECLDFPSEWNDKTRTGLYTILLCKVVLFLNRSCIATCSPFHIPLYVVRCPGWRFLDRKSLKRNNLTVKMFFNSELVNKALFLVGSQHKVVNIKYPQKFMLNAISVNAFFLLLNISYIFELFRRGSSSSQNESCQRNKFVVNGKWMALGMVLHTGEKLSDKTSIRNKKKQTVFPSLHLYLLNR